ncbi:MAG: CoA transferase [Acidaminococcales bacterium]|nr:CoA transferase [Acidaminococcales bacterium]
MKKALGDITVVDLTRVLSGPFSTMILADFGARVIHVELPGKGDDSRGFGPHNNGESGYFMSINRNKEGITLNMKAEQGKKILKQLIEKADVIVENFKPGTMEKLGFGYEDIVKYKPDIIYAACSGFGHTGPYSKRPAYDAIVQAMGGVMSITSAKEGGEPTRVGTSIGDITAGIFTAVGILTALHYKDTIGEGQKVDVAMLDCQVAILENALSRYFTTGTAPKPVGNRHPSVTPLEGFKCADGEYLIISIGNDKLWADFCNLVGRPELIVDPRFAKNADRTKNHKEIKPVCDEIMAERTSDEWSSLLEANAIPFTRINTVDKVANDPQVLAREMIVEITHPVAGKTKLAGVPVKLSKSPGQIVKAAPVLGADTESVLREIGYNAQEIKELADQGVI